MLNSKRLFGWLASVLTAIVIAGFIPAACADSSVTTRLNEEQATQIARTFCQKIGQPITGVGSANFIKPDAMNEQHYWLSRWEVTFPSQAEVEVVDATSVIIRYANDAYYVVHQDDNTPAGEAIPKQEAIQRAKAAVSATGQPEPLQFWLAQIEQLHPTNPLAKTQDWSVRWFRATSDGPYRDQHASVGLNAQTGEIEDLVIMFGSPPMAQAVRKVPQEDAAK